MRQQQQQPGDLFEDTRKGFNAVVFLLDVYASAVYPFIRTRRGVRSMGKEWLLALVLVTVYTSETRSVGMWAYWHAFLLMSVYRRVTADRSQITVYPGFPWAARLATLGMLRDEYWLRAVEPFLCLAFGLAVYPASPALGKFVGAGFILLRLKNGIEAHMRRRMRESMHDARISMEQYREFIER